MSKAAELAKWGEVSTNGQVSGRRNIVINGAMNVAQRATSATGLGANATTNTYPTVDRWNPFHGGTTAGRYTMTQTADGPSGFANCMKLDCTTADTSIAAGEEFLISHKLEGQDLQAIGKGTSDAKQLVVSWYAKGTPKTYGIEMYDNDNTRHFTNTWTVTSSWQRFTQVIPADTTGAFDDDNALSLYILFWLHGGSNFTSGSSASSWANVTAANRAVGVGSFFSSTDNELFITGVQMEVGSVATPFEHRSFGEELALCQRYFCHNEFNGGSLNVYQSELAYGQINHPVAMRAVPTITFQTTFTNFGIHYYGGNNTSGSSYQANATGTAKAMSFSHALSSGTHPSTRHSAHGYFDYLADAEL
jgi:hypothetical protein